MFKYPFHLLYPVVVVKTKICLHVLNDVLYNIFLVCENAFASETIVFTNYQINFVCFHAAIIIGKSNMKILAFISPFTSRSTIFPPLAYAGMSIWTIFIQTLQVFNVFLAYVFRMQKPAIFVF